MRHSTPIGGLSVLPKLIFFFNLFFLHNLNLLSSTEISPFAEKSDTAGDVSADVAMAASAIVPGDSGENTEEKGDGKLSLRMKLVTPVDEVNSDHFSLQSKIYALESLAHSCHFTVRAVRLSLWWCSNFFQNHPYQKKMEPQPRKAQLPVL